MNLKSINWYHKNLIGEWDLGGEMIKIYPGELTEDSVICGKILTEIELLDNPDGIFDFKLYTEGGKVCFSYSGLTYIIKKFEIENDVAILMVEIETNHVLSLSKPRY